MTIAVDFDGTIVEHRYPHIGKPIPFAFETLRALSSEGHRLILWTSRDGERLKEAVEYCRSNGVEFFAINSEYPDANWERPGDSRKLMADIYIDDKNIGGLRPWPEMYRLISKSGKHFADGAHHTHHHHHRKKLKLSFFAELKERTKEARESFKLQ